MLESIADFLAGASREESGRGASGESELEGASSRLSLMLESLLNHCGPPQDEQKAASGGRRCPQSMQNLVACCSGWAMRGT